MSKYDDFLTQLKEDHKTTAQGAIKRLYLLLKEDDPNLSKEDMYDRILKDCLTIWARSTIIANIPDELKDKERQASGRKGTDKQKKKRILTVTNTGNVASDMEAKSSPVDRTQQDSQTLVQASTNRNETSSFTMDRDAHEDNLVQFELWLPAQDVLLHLIPSMVKKEHREDRIWFSGILDKYTGKVISSKIGRRTQ
jgi:hypothetical protein